MTSSVKNSLHAAVGVVDDEPLLRAQQLVRDHEGPDGVVGRASPGVTDDVRIAFAEPGVLGGVQPGVHAGEDGEAARGRQGEIALVECGCVGLVGLEHLGQN